VNSYLKKRDRENLAGLLQRFLLDFRKTDGNQRRVLLYNDLLSIETT